MKLSIVSVLFLGLVAAAPAPVAAPPSYDRQIPARKGEPPAQLMRRGQAVDVAVPTATKPTVVVSATGTAKSPAKTAWPTSAHAIPTGTSAKAVVLKPTGTSVGTGTAASISGAPTAPAAKSSYNFPSPTKAKNDAKASPASGFWWLRE